MTECVKKFLAFLGILLLLPIVLTLFASGKNAVSLSKKPTIEDYVMKVACMQIPWNMDEEAIKAQCVIARTNLYREMLSGGNSTLKEAAAYYRDNKNRDLFRKHFLKFQKAAKETEGVILTWQGEVVELPFFRLSAGKTRSGAEVLGEEYDYLPSLAVAEDLESAQYLQGFYFTEQELEELLKKIYPDFIWEKDAEGQQINIMSTDRAGYVIETQVGNHVFLGEELRYYLGLSSSCFSVQFEGENVRFLCKGLGHGLGLSQYAANVMGQKGKSYHEILLRFYPGMEYTNLEELKN